MDRSLGQQCEADADSSPRTRSVRKAQDRPRLSAGPQAAESCPLPCLREQLLRGSHRPVVPRPLHGVQSLQVHPLQGLLPVLQALLGDHLAICPYAS